MRSGSDKGRGRWVVVAVGVGIVLLFGGWVSSLAQTDTEHKAEQTLSDLRINLTGDPNVPMPDIYKSPPKIFEQIVGGSSEWKLSYFCKNHGSDDLKKIIHEQFATKLFDKKGKETKLVDYTVTSQPSTNQLIVRCPTREDAEAVLEVLNEVDIPPIQVKIDCLISDVFADMTFDRETTIAIDNLFGEGVALKPGGTAFGANVQELVEEDQFLPAFPGASFRDLMRSRMGLAVGYLSTGKLGHEFTVLVDLLESRGYMKILMNPSLEVVNGKTATIMSTEHVPLQTITKFLPIRSGGSDYAPQTEIDYVDVIDSLKVTPHVFADGYIGLETDILVGARNTPDGVKQIPIVTKKQIENKENRIRPGESLIIGGLRKTEDFAVVRGVPILKDIPLLGFLFSSEDTEQRAIETIFILTPTISTGGRPREEVMSEVQRKHEPDSPKDLGEIISDPFGFKAKEQSRQRSLQEAEQSRLEAEVEKAQARIDVREANERAERAEAELSRIEAQAEKAISDAEAKARAAEEAIADAKKARAEAEEAKAQAEAKAKAAEENEKQDSGASGAGAKKTTPEEDKPKAQSPNDTDKNKAKG
ncbi:MAG: hypothetical protein JSW59_10455 [Phycisphaerales bacterium]|nr:MAG: hypothetical protein JSW59_10455 [Phycisphaerales bacterium]